VTKSDSLTEVLDSVACVFFMEHRPGLEQTLYTKDVLNRTFLFDVEKRAIVRSS